MTMLQKTLDSQNFREIAMTTEEFPRNQSHKSLVAVLHAKLLNDELWLSLIFVGCLYLAAKNLETTPRRHPLKIMMGNMYGREIHPQVVVRLELEILDALDWRLGPFYNKAIE